MDKCWDITILQTLILLWNTAKSWKTEVWQMYRLTKWKTYGKETESLQHAIKGLTSWWVLILETYDIVDFQLFIFPVFMETKL